MIHFVHNNGSKLPWSSYGRDGHDPNNRAVYIQGGMTISNKRILDPGTYQNDHLWYSPASSWDLTVDWLFTSTDFPSHSIQLAIWWTGKTNICAFYSQATKSTTSSFFRFCFGQFLSLPLRDMDFQLVVDNPPRCLCVCVRGSLAWAEVAKYFGLASDRCAEPPVDLFWKGKKFHHFVLGEFCFLLWVSWSMEV